MLTQAQYEALLYLSNASDPVPTERLTAIYSRLFDLKGLIAYNRHTKGWELTPKGTLTFSQDLRTIHLLVCYYPKLPQHFPEDNPATKAIKAAIEGNPKPLKRLVAKALIAHRIPAVYKLLGYLLKQDKQLLRKTEIPFSKKTLQKALDASLIHKLAGPNCNYYALTQRGYAKYLISPYAFADMVLGPPDHTLKLTGEYIEDYLIRWTTKDDFTALQKAVTLYKEIH